MKPTASVLHLSIIWDRTVALGVGLQVGVVVGIGKIRGEHSMTIFCLRQPRPLHLGALNFSLTRERATGETEGKAQRAKVNRVR
jgi:hypothetical protein